MPLPDWHKRKISAALIRTWNSMSKEEMAELHRKQQAGRERNPGKKSPRQKENFIGMLGDIEVYATNFGRVGRKLPDASAEWAGPAHGKPELKAKRPG